MRKRHQSNRRKAYGRRQHEVQERRQRERRPDALEPAWDEATAGGFTDRFGFLDARTARMRFATGD